MHGTRRDLKQNSRRALLDRVQEEQEHCQEWLLRQNPEEILKHAYEYSVRKDIAMSLEDMDISEEEAALLLSRRRLMDDLYEDYDAMETDYMEAIRNCIKIRLRSLETEQREQPVYQHSIEYAIGHGEQEAYRASYEVNVGCKKAIEAAIAAHYHDNYLGQEAVRQVVEQFGYDRPLYVLANTVRENENDGRFSCANKSWAREIPVADDKDASGRNGNREFAVSGCHPGLVNCFIDIILREYAITYHLTREDIRDEAGRILQTMQELPEPNSPDGKHFIVQFQPGFLARGDSRDMEMLMKMLPFSEIAFTALWEREGFYAMVPQEADRNKPLRSGGNRGSGKEKTYTQEGIACLGQKPVKRMNNSDC